MTDGTEAPLGPDRGDGLPRWRGSRAIKLSASWSPRLCHRRSASRARPLIQREPKAYPRPQAYTVGTDVLPLITFVLLWVPPRLFDRAPSCPDAFQKEGLKPGPEPDVA